MPGSQRGLYYPARQGWKSLQQGSQCPGQKQQQIQSSLTSGVTLASMCHAPEHPWPSTEEDATSGSLSQGAPCRAVKSSGPGAGLSELLTVPLTDCGECLLACYLAPLCLSLHIGKRSAPNPQRSRKGQTRLCTESMWLRA